MIKYLISVFYLLLSLFGMARIFLALTPDKDLNDRIIELKKDLKNNILSEAEISWQKNSDHHLTLNFVGSMEPEQIEEMYQGLTEINFMSHLQIQITNVNFFPNEDSQLLVAIVKPTNQILKIFERIDEVVTRIGFGSSLRAYRPHITLGRFKDKDRPQYSFEDFSEIQITSHVNKLDVYESEFDEGKTNYQLLKSFKF
ncbi:MAG: RNA 2',3'-cyclic phosphodiesterase [Pseudomonadota bacterium]|nr:RNA 2',3'-cyclic phosphodiesterase [Pseudomonadota bacterium]